MEEPSEIPSFRGSFTDDIKKACEYFHIDVPGDINSSIYNYSMTEAGFFSPHISNTNL